ncbi:MAG TPA: ribosome maturation factor RimM [Bryobacteraceae bacterium]|nr:ribosome maturation factor RimM [Bryobacteraceae bacterium]
MAVGRLIRARGNRGELIAEIYSSQPGRAERLGQVRLEKGSLSRMARVERVWRHQGRPVLKFEGIDSISGAEVWENADIFAGESEMARPGDGEYWHADLLGCRVFCEDTDRVIGVVAGIEDYGAPPLLKLDCGDGREILAPFARSICREIDPANKSIRAWLPEGLDEL